MNSAPTVAVVVITYKRPQYIGDCLRHLEQQTSAPEQIVVVDASPDDRTRRIVEDFPSATYLHNPAGAGNMTSSRNAALPLLHSDVIAFLDDDANAEPNYIEQLRTFCSTHPDVALGCARALNGVPGEELTGVDEIGVLSPSGRITGNFAADPGADVEIDHGLGATMWIRLSLLQRLGGFREYFPGTSACEDTDLFLRARRLSARAWLVRNAVVTHVAAPQEGGQRFDKRYTYWTAHNRAMLFGADLGIWSRLFWRRFAAELARNLSYGGAPQRRIARTLIVAVAWLRGTASIRRIAGTGPVSPIGGYRRPAR